MFIGLSVSIAAVSSQRWGVVVEAFRLVLVLVPSLGGHLRDELSGDGEARAGQHPELEVQEGVLGVVVLGLERLFEPHHVHHVPGRRHVQHLHQAATAI